ncbi:MAG: ferredoxin family protein [Terracidiphilus sp.]
MNDAKNPNGKRDRGLLRVDEQECKGCGLCIEACPPKVISMSERLNHYGYNTALYAGSGCTGCGICFMVCPEPGAITVYRLVSAQEVGERPGMAQSGGVDAASTAGLETGATRGAGAGDRLEGMSECASN